jgi:predicted amidohydrolase
MRLALAAIHLDVGDEVLASADAYRRHLDAAAARACDAGASAQARLLVFPEVAGHLALYALAPPAARRAKTLAAALATAAVRRPLEVLRGVASTRLLDARHAVLAALAPDAERFWKSVFGPLARRHAAYVVAGSHLRLAASGELRNSSLLFAPDGRHIATTDKVNLVPGLEDGAKRGLALARGDADALPIVETPFGRVATLIGYDAFARPRTALERFVPLGPVLAARGGVDVLANPTAAPDAATAGVAALLAEVPCARYAVTAHLSGGVLDLEFSGSSQVVERTDGEMHPLGEHVVFVGDG